MNVPFQFSDLDAFKTGGFPSDYPANAKRFYSPQDRVHEAFKALALGATQSLYLSMFGEDDPELTQIILAKAQQASIYVQINLDKTQAAGQAEVPLVKLLEGCPATRVAVGMSLAHKINHLKMMVVDGLYTLSGSTNWSGDGENKQNNEATVHMDRAIAAEAISILTLEHQEMLAQTKA